MANYVCGIIGVSYLPTLSPIPMMHRLLIKHRALVACLPLLLPFTGAAGEEFSDADLEFFEARVRPLLVEHCHACHSAEHEIEAGLRLDFRDGLLSGGDNGPAIVPGKPDESRLVEAIGYENVDLQMPPDGKLPKEVIETLTQWVRRGAPWPKESVAATAAMEDFDLEKRKQEHWCWAAIGNPQTPTVTKSDWARDPIDRFILARLEAAGLSPASDAERVTLIRRLYFDLIGLPPTPEQVSTYLGDTSADATEKLIDGLLDSPHFGERWARHWMDLMRYAESHGHEFDYPIHYAYEYRDYLIRAFNADVPYDQFIMEHLAGDLMSQPRLHPQTHSNESAIGTAFWWLGEATHSPVDVKGDEAVRIDNQIDVVGKSFLGLTIACARCHDHKFDAISTKDYYAMAGFLQSSRRNETLIDPGGRIAKATAEIKALQSKGTSILRQQLGQGAGNQPQLVAKYLLASREVLYGPPEAQLIQDDVLFEDFESDTYDGWTVTGTAFGTGPQSQQTVGNYQGEIKAKGKGFVNSHQTRDEKRGDQAVGRMTSKAFEIKHPKITFLVGGGNHAGKTCVNLLVDGKVVRTQTGFASNQMRPAEFDCSDLIGKTANIEVVDDHRSGWGNIGLDHIVFTGRSGFNRSIESVASERGLDAELLGRWVNLVNAKGLEAPEHALHIWHRFQSHAPDEKIDLKPIAGDLTNRHRRATEQRQREDIQLVQFEGGLPDGWSIDGPAFQPSGPMGMWHWHRSPSAIGAGDVIDSRSVSPRLNGALRSPTFQLGHNNIHILASGKNVQCRLIIDGYYMFDFNGLLFGGVHTKIDSPEAPRWFTIGGDTRRYKGHRAYIELIDKGDSWCEVHQVCFSDHGAPGLEPSRTGLAIADQHEQIQSLSQLASAYGSVLTSSSAGQELRRLLLAAGALPVEASIHQSLTSLADQISQLDSGLPQPRRVLGLVDGTPENEFVFIRGNHRTLGEEAPRKFLQAITDEQSNIANGSGRLQLARSIASPANPLTARVMANRLWHHLFGRGIVASTDNFGVLGQRPTHPELLDHLAQRLIKNQWSLKKTIKQIVMSRTYQMSSSPDAEATEKDPTNQWLHRQRIRRLQGEAIRDSILVVSGQLKPNLFGPSVDVHLTSFMSGRGRPRSGPVDGGGRRSIYTSIKRNFLSPMMIAFDTPIPFNSVGRRNVSNVPGQALILMNSPFVLGQAQAWGARIAGSGKTVTEQINAMYMEAYSQPATASQLQAATQFVEAQAKELRIAPERISRDTRVWADLGHVLINTKAFSYVF